MIVRMVEVTKADDVFDAEWHALGAGGRQFYGKASTRRTRPGFYVVKSKGLDFLEPPQEGKRYCDDAKGTTWSPRFPFDPDKKGDRESALADCRKIFAEWTDKEKPEAVAVE